MADAPAATVFLDRDGTINVEKEFLHRIDDFEFVEGAPQAIARLNKAGALVIVVSNQAGVALGYYPESDVQALHDHVQAELQRFGAHIDAFYYCPYHPDGTLESYRKASACRKPRPSMFKRAIRDFQLKGDRRFVVGDKLNDLVAGAQVGCATVLVRTGYGEEHLKQAATRSVCPDHVARDLADAVDWILNSLPHTV